MQDKDGMKRGGRCSPSVRLFRKELPLKDERKKPIGRSRLCIGAFEDKFFNGIKI